MTIEQFAEKHRLKTKRDDDGTTIIPGRRGHIYEYDVDEGLLGVCLMLKSARAYGYAKRRLHGVTTVQDGDFEGCFAFDPTQTMSGAKQALREAGIRSKRVPTVAQAESLKRARERSPI